MHEGQRGIAQVVGPLFGDLHAAGIGGDDGDVIGGVLGLDVVRQDGLGVHVVHRTVEEALNLIRVQVHRDDAVRAGCLQEICDQAGGDGLAAQVLFILTRIWVERQDRGNALGGTTLQRIDHDELFHQPLIKRLGMRLHDEAVSTAHGLFEADEDLTIGEVPGGGRNQISLEFLCHCLCQFWVCAPRKELHVLATTSYLASHRRICPFTFRCPVHGLRLLPLGCPDASFQPSLRYCAVCHRRLRVLPREHRL